MSIQHVSGSKSNLFTPSNNNYNEIKQLEKTKSRLQDQITKINESKLDDKTKQERIKLIQDRIKQIDIQIQTIKTEKVNENQNKDQQKSTNQTDEVYKNDDGDSLVIAGLIEAKATYSKAEIMNRVKKHLHSDGRTLKKEIEDDESRSVSGSKAVTKRQQLEEIEAREKVLNKKAAETNKTTRNQVEEASRKAGGNESNAVKDTETAAESTANKILNQDISTEGGSRKEKDIR